MRTYVASKRIPRRIRDAATAAMLTLVLLSLGSATAACAQTFDSGSDGSDGVLELTTAGVVDFNPVELGLDADGDNIYHFTTITIGAGVTVRLAAAKLSGPVFWLSQGAIVIDGTIDLNGEAGQGGQQVTGKGSSHAAIAGAGGFGGGVGGVGGLIASPAQPGNGPGGATTVSTTGYFGGPGAGHATVGCGRHEHCNGCGSEGRGQAYGNLFLIPTVGGSGGAGGAASGVSNGGGGGAGGGAILIASTTSIAVNGTIRADGGAGGGSAEWAGGGGSGGAIRLVSPTIQGAGTVRAKGGARGLGRVQSGSCGNGVGDNRHGGSGSDGRIRIEAFNDQLTKQPDPTAARVSPVGLFLPQSPPASLRVVSVDGKAINNPTATFTPADVDISTNASVVVIVEARNIPLQTGAPSVATTVKLYLVSENAADQILTSTPLSGTFDISTASVSVTFPSGFSRGYVRATWTR